MIHLVLLFCSIPILSWSQDSLINIPPKNLPFIASDTIKQQRVATKNYLRKDIWRVDFLGPGYLNEHRLGKQISLASQIRLVGACRIEERIERTGLGYSYDTKNVFAFSVNPELSIAIRHFYNLAKRKMTGRPIRYNSGSYFAVKTDYIAPALYKNTDINLQGLGISLLWGVQQTLPKHFYVKLEFGVGMAQYYKNNVSPTGDFMLGYTF